VPLTLETLEIILPFSLTMAAVGLLESLLTAQIVDDLTDTGSDKAREVKGQGIANFFTGFLGGMGGCAMIGQSVINVTSGGRGRLSTFTAGAFLMFLLAVLGPYVGQVPMPALVAIMIMVSISTFSWNSIPNLRRHPWPSSVVMLTTVAVVVGTHDLSLARCSGCSGWSARFRQTARLRIIAFSARYFSRRWNGLSAPLMWKRRRPILR
jgi:SulP family sulfate permease